MNSYLKVKRFLRYINLYGPLRALVKACYHLDNSFGNKILYFLFRANDKSRGDRVFISGLGNHGFTLISFAIIFIGRRSICGVIDPSERAKFLARSILRCNHYHSLSEAVQSNNFFGDVLYVCSDHHSHLAYALAAVGRFSNVYIEKPLIVSDDQIPDLFELAKSDINVFTGFNRPNSPFFQQLLHHCGEVFNITFVVNGHFLPSDHWYRESKQGSRILGNLTHWLDLSYRIFVYTDSVTPIDICLVKGHLDDVTIVLSQCNRTINICFSANSEPVDGVEEFIHWNSLSSTGFVNNFRSIALYNGAKKIVKHKLRKDVGHIQTVLTPFKGKSFVDSKFVNSALFCLIVENMYKTGIIKSQFQLTRFEGKV